MSLSGSGPGRVRRNTASLEGSAPRLYQSGPGLQYLEHGRESELHRVIDHNNVSAATSADHDHELLPSHHDRATHDGTSPTNHNDAAANYRAGARAGHRCQLLSAQQRGNLLRARRILPATPTTEPPVSQGMVSRSLVRTMTVGDGNRAEEGEPRMAIFKWFLPRKVRRVAHPVGYAKRRMTPKPVRSTLYVRHPVGTATSAATRRALQPSRRRRRPG